ncbi:TPA: LPXTG cell wall anchor domain-containing protein, partial [Streptococcus pneumoniae]|nr:LPXTG cell wall anchor domain-containing protein [Streptococcus pneumoniae]
EMSSTIVSEEDFILPVYKGELEKGYQFDGWEISGFEGKKDAGYVINLSKDTFIKPVFKKIEEKKEEENKPTFDVSKKKDNPQVNHSQLNESHRKEDLQREEHSQKSDSTKDVTATVLDKNNISSKSTTNNPNKLPKTGTASGVQTLLAAGIMFIVGIFLGLKKKNQD